MMNRVFDNANMRKIIILHYFFSSEFQIFLISLAELKRKFLYNRNIRVVKRLKVKEFPNINVYYVEKKYVSSNVSIFSQKEI